MPENEIKENLNYDSFVSIVLCSRKGRLDQLERMFGRLFMNFSTTYGKGGWLGEKFVETEANVTITTWLNSAADNSAFLHRFVKYARQYQTVEEQEAVSVVYTSPAGWHATVVFTQWDEVETALKYAFCPEYRAAVDAERKEQEENARALALADWFDRQVSAAETAEGVDVSDHHWLEDPQDESRDF